jgi:hypothetical protein
MEIHLQKVQGMSIQKLNTQKENQGHQNNSNKMEGVMLKGHYMPQIS